MPVTYQARRAGRLPAISPVARCRCPMVDDQYPALPPHPHHAVALPGHRSAAQTQLSWLRANGFESITPRTCSTTSTPAPTCQRSQSMRSMMATPRIASSNNCSMNMGSKASGSSELHRAHLEAQAAPVQSGGRGLRSHGDPPSSSNSPTPGNGRDLQQQSLAGAARR